MEMDSVFKKTSGGQWRPRVILPTHPIPYAEDPILIIYLFNIKGYFITPLEFVFYEQSYSSLHSGQSLARDHIRGDIDDPCGTIADFSGVIANFCRVIADPWGDRKLRDRRCGDGDRCAIR